jgi:hypothetical protein
MMMIMMMMLMMTMMRRMMMRMMRMHQNLDKPSGSEAAHTPKFEMFEMPGACYGCCTHTTQPIIPAARGNSAAVAAVPVSTS